MLTDEGRQQIADTIGVNINDVNHMEQRLSGADLSLNAPVGETRMKIWLQDFLMDDRPTPEQSVCLSKDASTLSAWSLMHWKSWSPREKMIILRRRLDEDGATLDELGKDFRCQQRTGASA